MDSIAGALTYLVAGGSIGAVGAYALRGATSGRMGLTWRAESWPQGVQEEEPHAGWGEGALRETAEPVLDHASIEDVAHPDVPVVRVRRGT